MVDHALERPAPDPKEEEPVKHPDDLQGYSWQTKPEIEDTTEEGW